MRNYALGALALMVLASCGRQSPLQQAQALEKKIAAAAADARAASEKSDGKAARRAAGQAQGALAELEKLAGSAADAAITAMIEPARASVRETDEVAELAENRAYVAERCSGFKATAYRATEGVAIKAFCELGAAACDQAARAPLASLPESVRSAAESAADLDQALTGRAPRPDGTPDFAAIATALRAAGSTPPPELHMVLAGSHLAMGHDDLALIEVQAADAAALSKDKQMALRVERIVIYRLHRLGALARQETRDASAAGQDLSWFTPEVQASFHVVLAMSYLQERDARAADLEIARAVQQDPNNPLTVFLTGERLLADGKREEAADSMEKRAAGTKQEWLAQAVSERVRQLRDSKAPAEPILFSGTFLRSVGIHYLKEASSQGARKLGELVTTLQEKVQGAATGK